jgi:hypothetical protein
VRCEWDEEGCRDDRERGHLLASRCLRSMARQGVRRSVVPPWLLDQLESRVVGRSPPPALVARPVDAVDLPVMADGE